MKELLEVLRVQRHNFLNHLQVISGLLQLKKYDRVSEYIMNIGNEYNQASMVGRIEIPEIASAILIEELAAGKHGISIDKQINTCMDKGISSVTETADILREILGNASCLIASSDCERTIKLKIGENGDQYEFEVGFMCSGIKDMNKHCNTLKEKTEKITGNISFRSEADYTVIIFTCPV